MRAILLASAAMVVARAFMSETVEVVHIVGTDGKPIRVNKSDYDADQSDNGAKAMTLHENQSDVTQNVPGGVQFGGVAPNVPITAAPAAPNFKSADGEGSEPLIDPAKNAAAPTAPSPNQRLVSKEGKGASARFYAVDGTGAKLDGVEGNVAGFETEQGAWAAIMALPH